MAVNSLSAKITLPKKLANWTHLTQRFFPDQAFLVFLHVSLLFSLQGLAFSSYFSLPSQGLILGVRREKKSLRFGRVFQ